MKNPPLGRVVVTSGMEIFWVMLLKPFVALAFMAPAFYGAKAIHKRMKPGRLKSFLFKRIS